MSEKQMTLEEVAHGILNQTHTIERCGLWAAAIRAHKCGEPDPEKWVSVEKVREAIHDSDQFCKDGCDMLLTSIEAILPKPHDPLAALEAEMLNTPGLPKRWLALVREARKERDGEA